MKQVSRFVVSIGLALLTQLALAAPPQTINYQGFLTNPGGTPVSNTVAMTFKFYNAASAGTLLHTELQPTVIVANGNFNVLLGSPTPIPLPFDVPYWLTVTINGDPEMSPRQPLASSPYAFRAASLESTATIAGSQIDVSGNVTLVNSTVSTGNILKGASPFIHNFGTTNTFVGVNAGNFTMTGPGQNTATGTNALTANLTGNANTANGASALISNTSGSLNTANGGSALARNTSGNRNTASGVNALFFNTTGADNIAIGKDAGFNLTTGNNNIAIGNLGVATESSTTRIGDLQTRAFIAGIRGVATAVNDALPVVIDSQGQLGSGGTSVPAGGISGQILQGAPAGPQWTSSPALSGGLSFGNTARQMLNLWGAEYAIGVQDFTMYHRTSGHFAWYLGGTHVNTPLTPGGPFGTILMTLTDGDPPPISQASSGVVRAASFLANSDRNAKEAFDTVDVGQVLAALVQLPLQSWKYRNESAAVRHIGPTAQDFRAAFSIGYDDKTIATVDADGVALAAIQGLNAKVSKQLAARNAEIDVLKGEIAELRRAVEVMMARMALEGKVAQAR